MCGKVGQSGLFSNFTPQTDLLTPCILLFMQFLGSIEAKLDAKMRVFIPANFRKILQVSAESALILRKDLFQNCLVLYPISVWEEELAKLRNRLNRWDRNHQQLFRQFVVDAERLDMDASGRILIPKRLLSMVEIDSEIQFLGVDNTIEIWSKKELESTFLTTTDFSAEIEKIMSGDCLDD